MNYKNKLLYSSKHITKKNRKLKYYYCVDFDGKTLIVEKVKNPPMAMVVSNKGFEKYRWNVYSLDLLSKKYAIKIINEDVNNEN